MRVFHQQPLNGEVEAKLRQPAVEVGQGQVRVSTLRQAGRSASARRANAAASGAAASSDASICRAAARSRTPHPATSRTKLS